MDISRAVTAALFILALLFTTGWSRPSTPETTKCDPKKTYSDGCNTCFCHENGRFACSMMACFDKSGKSTIGPIVEVKTKS